MDPRLQVVTAPSHMKQRSRQTYSLEHEIGALGYVVTIIIWCRTSKALHDSPKKAHSKFVAHLKSNPNYDAENTSVSPWAQIDLIQHHPQPARFIYHVATAPGAPTQALHDSVDKVASYTGPNLHLLRIPANHACLSYNIPAPPPPPPPIPPPPPPPVNQEEETRDREEEAPKDSDVEEGHSPDAAAGINEHPTARPSHVPHVGDDKAPSTPSSSDAAVHVQDKGKGREITPGPSSARDRVEQVDETDSEEGSARNGPQADAFDELPSSITRYAAAVDDNPSSTARSHPSSVDLSIPAHDKAKGLARTAELPSSSTQIEQEDQNDDAELAPKKIAGVRSQLALNPHSGQAEKSCSSDVPGPSEEQQSNGAATVGVQHVSTDDAATVNGNRVTEAADVVEPKAKGVELVASPSISKWGRWCMMSVGKGFIIVVLKRPTFWMLLMSLVQCVRLWGSLLPYQKIMEQGTHLIPDDE